MTIPAATADLARYAKQTRYAPLGEAGQRQLMASRVLVVGCGALGSVLAETLVRAGVGSGEPRASATGGPSVRPFAPPVVRLVDRDFLELSNLPRQALYNEEQATAGLPKAIAAADSLRQINSATHLEPVIAHVSHSNLAELADGVDLIVDGTDNFETRLLLNDYAVKHRVPWVYGGVIGAEGRVMPVLPGETACLACLVPEPPTAGQMPTCDSAGVLGAAVNVIASIQSLEAIKLLSGNRDAMATGLTVVDLWSGRWHRLSVPVDPHCRCCGEANYEWLDGRRGSQAVVLCGRGAVQFTPEGSTPVDLPAMRAKLAPLGEVTANLFLLRLRLSEANGGHGVTLFADGRAIISGVEDEAQARTVWNRYIGG